MLSDAERAQIARLPIEAQKRFYKLQAQLDGLFGAAHARSDEKARLRQAIESQTAWIKKTQAEPPYPKNDEAFISTTLDKIALDRAALADLDAADAADAEKRSALFALTRAALELATGVPVGMMLVTAKRPLAALRKSEAVIDAIARCRARVQALKNEILEVEAAPWPAAIAKVNARREIEALAEAGRPEVAGMIEAGDRALRWPQTVVHIQGGPGLFSAPNALAVTAWLHRDAMIAAVERELDAVADDANALAPADRKVKLAKLSAQILETERDESDYIAAAAKQGIVIAHRGDIDIRALLGLADAPVAAPAKPVEPYKSKAGRTPNIEAPTHANSLPKPALRDPVWQ